MSESAGRSGTFTLIGEDYTLANALRTLLNRNPHVEFCGYSAPHPSEDLINIRVQTTGDITAKQALKQAAMQLKKACQHIKDVYQEKVDEYNKAHNREIKDDDDDDDNDDNDDNDGMDVSEKSSESGGSSSSGSSSDDSSE